jgi:SAM-dependent methyltransferase
MVSINNKQIDYGIDAPGIRLGMFIIGGVGITMIGLSFVLKNSSTISFILCFTGIIIASYGSFMASYMTYGSKIGKLKTRDRLLDAVGEYLKWEELKRSLDIGCGRGLLLIGSAQRIGKGVSIGIDIWSTNDQSNNSETATFRNVALAGVSDKVQIQTADARNLPFENESIDLVMSHWVIHNIEPENEQLISLDEMYRVLKPGGVILLADIQNVKKNIQHFEHLGGTIAEFNDGGLETKIMSVLSGGTYVPKSMICIKPK